MISDSDIIVGNIERLIRIFDTEYGVCDEVLIRLLMMCYFLWQEV